jgi:hypothetical protein
MSGFRSHTRSNRFGLAGFVLSLLLGLPAGHAQRIAILPVDGAAEVVAELNRKLPSTVARQLRTEVLSPSVLSRHLRESNDAEAVREAARAELASAEKAVLFMNRKEAIAGAQKSITQLEEALGQYHCPELMARAYGVQALALLLDPKDEEGAVQAFHTALVVNPRYQPNPDHLTPTVERLLARAHTGWQQPRPPALEVLKQVAQAVNVAQVFWLSARVDPQGLLLLQLTQIDAQGQLLEQHQIRNLAASDLLPQAAQWIVQSLGKNHTPLPWSVLEQHGTGSTGATTSPPTAWYRKWWVWTATGVVLASVGVGLAVGLSSSNDSSDLWDLRVQFVPGKP